MSDRYVEILKDSRLSWNNFPSGRQLLRTPPLAGVKQQLDFCSEDSGEEHEEPRLNMEADSSYQDHNDPNVTFDYNKMLTKTEPDDPGTMLKGMKGYQLTETDSEFIEKMKGEKAIKKLQGDLKEVQRLLNKELMPLELALASREKAQADLMELPSSEDLMEWTKEVLRMTSPSTQLADLDLNCLLDTVTRENLQRATQEKKVEITRMENMVANKKKREAKERGQLEKKIASQQLKVHKLMSQMSNLESELSQEEEAYKALEMLINTQEAPGMEAEKEELQDVKLQAKPRGKGRTKAVTFAVKIEEPAKGKSKSRSKLADSETDGVKHDQANRKRKKSLETVEAEKPAKSVKESEGPQKKVEKQEASSQEPLHPVGGRGKKPAATQPKRGVKTEEVPSTTRREAPSQGRKLAAAAGGAEESQNGVLRRSKRIASRT
ncbi:hypothetical protein PBY51_017010 [Eleginops maclovinus]|uniref:Uncharacterized protein n=1 Tax=Eleginops maclovinus TaxID=56733 RepID=A0AAN8A9E3_ELEMC|nr:hypothetical protein PBY51_017010 [Eleginops maclovinus]